MTAAECTELAAVLELQVAKQEAADRIVASMNHYLEGRIIASQVQREREHFKRVADSSGCADCLSMCGDGVCNEHSINKDYL